MKQLLSISATALKMLLGMLFFFSAASKYVSLDQFEIYIYSFHFFSFGFCFLAARLVVAGELLLGALLLSNKFHRLASMLNILLLLGFILFLGFVQLSGRTDSCHCFGEVLPFNPLQSILKNAVLLLLSLYAWRYTNICWRPSWWLASLMAIIPFVIIVGLGFLGKVTMLVIDAELLGVLALCMMAVGVLSSLFLWRTNEMCALWHSRWLLLVVLMLTPFVATAVITTTPEDWSLGHHQYPFNEPLFIQAIQPENPLAAVHTTEGPKIVALYSTHCTYCKATAQKINAIQQSNHLPENAFVNVFMGSDSIAIQQFYNATHTTHYLEISIDSRLFTNLTRGQFPLVLLLNGDSVYQTFSTAIPEKTFVDFLSHK